MIKILLCEDSPEIADLLIDILQDYFTTKTSIKWVKDGKECRAYLKNNFCDVILLDIGLPGERGTDLLSFIKHTFPSLPIIMLTGIDDIQLVVECIKNGAFEYLKKPINPDLFIRTIKEALAQNNCKENNSYLTHSHSPKVQKIYRVIAKAASKDVSILLRGESGTGKEFFAKQIHRQSKRYQAPYIIINTPAIASSIAESELFGHEKGSFTGAVQTKIGKMEIAHKGTLFLDEIGDISHDIQAKLLRVLQEKKIERVGGTSSISLDVRFISATSRNLETMISENNFRSDLYYRLAELELHIPPLRERIEDIPFFIEYFAKQFCQEHNIPYVPWDKSIIQSMCDYSWPGNIRELNSQVKRLLLLSENGKMDPEEVSYFLKQHNCLNLKPKPEQPEKAELLSSIKNANYNLTETAKILNISRSTLYRKLKKYKIDLNEF